MLTLLHIMMVRVSLCLCLKDVCLHVYTCVCVYVVWAGSLPLVPSAPASKSYIFTQGIYTGLNLTTSKRRRDEYVITFYL